MHIKLWKKKYLKPEDDSRITYQLQPLKKMLPLAYTIQWGNW
jgi:hypothetical protein